MDVTVIDMGTLQFAWDADSHEVVVQSDGLGILLRTAIAEQTSDREAIFTALDRVLDQVRLPDPDGQWRPVALYNPLSGQVSVGALPETEVYGTDLVELSPFGTPARCVDGHLVADRWELQRVVPDIAAIQQAIAAH